MEMRGQDKEIKMAATTLGYNLPNRDSSSSSATVGQRSSDQPQNSHHHHHHLYTPPLALPQNQQPQRPTSTTDPDLSSSPVAATTSTTPITPRTVTATAPQQTRSKIWYRECMKNHAASMGSHVVDGCGEFMPSGEEGSPESLKCAACECHRNFHRKEVEGEQQPQPQPQNQHQHQHQHVPNYQSYYPNTNNKHNNGHLQFPTPPPSVSLPHQHHRFSHVLPTHTAGPVPPVMMAFGGPAESSSEDLNMFQCNAGAQVSVQAQPVSKKRFRTKFSQQQKDRMMEFAEKLGWKIQKHDEQEVQQFCSQIGIKRQVFKVWMHNNKQAMKKQQM